MRNRRRSIAIGLTIVVLSLILIRMLADVVTDWWWARSVRQATVWSSIFQLRLVLLLAAALASFVVVSVNVAIAQRIARQLSIDLLPGGLPWPGIMRFGRRFLPLAFGAFSVLLLAPVASTWWDLWIRFRHGGGFPSEPEYLGRGVDFYVFQLPFLRAVSLWTTGLLIVTMIATVATYEMLGGARLFLAPRRLPHVVRGHLLGLVVLIAVTRAVATWWERSATVLRSNGFVRGIGATDSAIRVPALLVLSLIALGVAAVALYEMRRGGLTLTISAVIVWIIAGLLGEVIVPRTFQSLSVNSNEQRRETPSIERNIFATRAGFELDLPTTSIAGGSPSRADVAGARVTLNNPVLWENDSTISLATFSAQQTQKDFFSLQSLDLGVYDVGNGPEPILLGVRERNENWLATQPWQSRTRVKTHGNGLVAARAGGTTAEGDPLFVRSGLPSEGELSVTEERMYFGEEGAPVIVGGGDERDYADGGAVALPYKGADGIELDRFGRRLAFALRLGDINLITPGFDERNAKIMLYRNVRQRVAAIAPFLQLDADPYLVVTKSGRVVWVLDAYTTSDSFPHSAVVNLSAAGVQRTREGIRDGSSYIRGSVRITMDAYDGRPIFYANDDRDPVLNSYRRAFPKMFRQLSTMPADIRAHLRYPLDLFKVQAQLHGTYFIEDPEEFFSLSQRRQIAGAPSALLDRNASATPVQTAPGVQAPNFDDSGLVSTAGDPVSPSAVMLPGTGGQPRLGYTLPMVRADGGQLRAYLEATTEDGVSKLRSVEFNSDSLAGPILTARNMGADPEVSEWQTANGQRGSEVRLGSVRLLPVGSTIISVRPLFVASTQKGSAGESSVPLLKRVVASDDKGRVVMAQTYRDAIDQLLATAAVDGGSLDGPGIEVPTEPSEPSASGVAEITAPGPNATIGELLDFSVAALDAANEALRNGDLGEYQRLVTLADASIRQAQVLSDTQ
jgi:uncharacterized protein